MCLSVRSVSAISPVISIHEVGNVGATKSERAGISKLKLDMKQVAYLGYFLFITLSECNRSFLHTEHRINEGKLKSSDL